MLENAHKLETIKQKQNWHSTNLKFVASNIQKDLD